VSDKKSRLELNGVQLGTILLVDHATNSLSMYEQQLRALGNKHAADSLIRARALLDDERKWHVAEWERATKPVIQ
jgi:hypothetical protein